MSALLIFLAIIAMPVILLIGTFITIMHEAKQAPAHPGDLYDYRMITEHDHEFLAEHDMAW